MLVDTVIVPSFSPTSENDTYGQEAAEIYELSGIGSSVTTAAVIVEGGGGDLVDVRSGRWAQIWAFAALVWSMFMEGWNDGTNGPLLPAMQRHYHVRHRSLIFPGSFLTVSFRLASRSSR